MIKYEVWRFRKACGLVKYKVWRLRKACGVVKYEVWRLRKACGVVKYEVWRHPGYGSGGGVKYAHDPGGCPLIENPMLDS